jgi:Mor family transcriptional regulator
MRMPTSAQEFVRVIGLDATLKLAEVAKDRRVYVPHRLSDDHPITQAVGREHGEALVKAFGGSMMPLASCRSARRSRSIAQGFVHGWKVRDLVQAHDVSERTVYRALGRVTTGDVDRGPEWAGAKNAEPHPPGIGSSEGVPCG